MSADLRLVGDAADGHAHELAAERICDRGAEGCLADAGRSDEAKDRPLQITFQFEHGQKFEHALLHLLQSVMPLVEDLLGFHQVEAVLGLLPPRNLKDGVEMAFDDGVIR